MAVLVVDEAVLSFGGRWILPGFAARIPGSGHRFRDMVRLEDPERLVDAVPPPEDDPDVEFEEAKMMDDSVGGAAPMGRWMYPLHRRLRRGAPSVQNRRPSWVDWARRVKPSTIRAYGFQCPGALHQSPHGCVRSCILPITLPDNLTRYRVMVVAVAGDTQFGKGESSITARLPIMLRPSPPRFLNFGDVFELPLVIQNQTDTAKEVRVAARAMNLGFVSDASTAQPGGPSEPSVGRVVTRQQPR